MDELLVLVHAPVLGPASWAAVADELTRRGHRVAVPSLDGFTEGGPPYVPRLLRRAYAQLAPAPARVVLVVHSGAGVFAPYLAARAGGEVSVIFADAALPTEKGEGRVIDEAFLPFVRGLARGGLVPPWPQWWPEEDLAPLFPDEATRQRVSAEARPLPLGFFEETLPPLPAGWRSYGRAFLRLSEGYREPARQVAARGWPVRELPGEHLHMLADPAAVATAITGLAGQLPPS